MCIRDRDILELIAQSLEEGNRIEVRGFGSFSLHHRQPRVGRNPKTGDSVKLDAKSVPHFKAVSYTHLDTRYYPDLSIKQARFAYKLEINEFRGNRNVQLLVDYIEPVSL